MPTLNIELPQETLDGLEKAIKEDGGQLNGLIVSILTHWIENRNTSISGIANAFVPEPASVSLDEIDEALTEIAMRKLP